jgi:hypothetical protein
MVKSAYFTQLPDFARKGLIDTDGAGYPVITGDVLGIPLAVKSEIENLFGQVKKGEHPASKLKEELDRWEVFEQYQDRFFDLFRKRRW